MRGTPEGVLRFYGNIMNYPKRKRTRLKDFDYSENGAYFITICTKDKKKILGRIPIIKGDTSNSPVGQAAPCLLVADKNTSGQPTVGQGLAPAEVILSKYGQIAEQELRLLETRFPSIKIDQYVIMPNHIHMIVVIQNDAAGASPCPTTVNNVTFPKHPTVSDVICVYKSLVTRACKKNGYVGMLFQSSFHDHIIRNEQDYLEIWKYIENNPAKWEEDSLYIK